MKIKAISDLNHKKERPETNVTGLSYLFDYQLINTIDQSLLIALFL